MEARLAPLNYSIMVNVNGCANKKRLKNQDSITELEMDPGDVNVAKYPVSSIDLFLCIQS